MKSGQKFVMYQNLGTRDWRIDIMRVCAVLAVIGIHVFAHMSHVMENCRYPNNISLFTQTTNFAVPSFFVISGYLVCERLSQLEKQYRFKYVLQKIWRVYRLYLIWELIYVAYLVNPKAIYWTIRKLSLLSILFGPGTHSHLWFLPVLCVGYFAIYLSHNIKSIYIIGLICILYFLVLAAGPYNVMFKKAVPSFNNNYLAGISFCLLGTVINKNRAISESMPLWIPMVLLTSGLILVLLESRYLYSLNSTFRPDFMIGTIAYAGWFLLLPQSSTLFRSEIFHNVHVARFAEYAFGVYLIHPLVVEAFKPLFSQYAVTLSEYPYLVYHCLVCVVFLSSVISVCTLSRLKLKWIIS